MFDPGTLYIIYTTFYLNLPDKIISHAFPLESATKWKDLNCAYSLWIRETFPNPERINLPLNSSPPFQFPFPVVN